MKKAMLLILVLALTLAFATPALAEDPITTENGIGTTNVTYSVSSSFSVTIPDSVTLGAQGAPQTANVVLAADHVLPVGKTLNFAITAGTNYDETDKWRVISEGKTYKYTINENTTVLDRGDKVSLKVTDAATAGFAEATKTLSFELAEAVKFAGEYTDALTFTITLDDNA